MQHSSVLPALPALAPREDFVFGVAFGLRSGLIRRQICLVFGLDCLCPFPRKSRKASKALSASAILTGGALAEPGSAIPICCA